MFSDVIEFQPVQPSLTLGIPRVERYGQYLQTIFVPRGYRFATLITASRANFGGPLVLDLLDRRGWAPADVYFACAIARALGIPCLDVVHRYERNPGVGWGNLAKQMGIKPGSREFHALKNGAVGTYDRWGYPIRIDQRVSVDWSKHGPGQGKGGGKPAQAGSAKPDHAGHGQGNSGRGPGNSGKGNSGKGNGKGNGRD